MIIYSILLLVIIVAMVWSIVTTVHIAHEDGTCSTGKGGGVVLSTIFLLLILAMSQTYTLTSDFNELKNKHTASINIGRGD